MLDIDYFKQNVLLKLVPVSFSFFHGATRNLKFSTVHFTAECPALQTSFIYFTVLDSWFNSFTTISKLDSSGTFMSPLLKSVRAQN